MEYIEAISDAKPKFPTLFLAGGITDCPDWQAELVDYLRGGRPDCYVTTYEKSLPITVFNPRRANFPIHNPDASKEQTKWEYERLRVADIVSFWFCEETLCPIVLYELGKAIGYGQHIIVGVHPNYRRKTDVEMQLALARNKERVAVGFKVFCEKVHQEILTFCNL